MKKTHLIIAALAAITLAGTVPVQAETLKEKAAQQFNNSINRFRSCIRGKCTKMEALKLSRDVAIAAAAVLAAIYGMYGIGKAVDESAKLRFWEEEKEEQGRVARLSTRVLYRGGRTLTAPARAIEAGARATGKAAKKLGELYSGKGTKYRL